MFQIRSYLVSVFILFAFICNAQLVRPLPAFVVSKGEAPISTSRYVADSGQVMLFSNNKCWWFTPAGQLLKGPVILNTIGEDVMHPQISRSGKTVLSYAQGEDFLEDNVLRVFNQDSGYITGSYKTTSRTGLDRVRFVNDSLVNFYTHLDEYKGNYMWNTLQGQVNFQSLVEDSVHSGLYDRTYYKNKIFLVLRHRDSVGFITVDRTAGDKEYYEFHKLSSLNVTNHAQFTEGYPYLLLGDESTGTTKIFKPADTSFTLVSELKKLPQTLATAATENNCYILYRDTSMPAVTQLKLLDVNSNRELLLPFTVTDLNHFVFQIYAEQHLVIASHLTNGSLLAFNFLKNKFEWQFVAPSIATTTEVEKPEAAENKLFKVLIKQGSRDVTNSYLDTDRDQLYLIKNNDQLVTVDVQSKCAVSWESFYKGNDRVTNASLLPGNQFILYTEERWKKDPAATKKNYLDEIEYDEDLQKKYYNYPYATKVYNRALKKTVLNLQSKEQLEVEVINDSLVCWVASTPDTWGDSVVIYNLNSGTMVKTKPLPGSTMLGFHAKMIDRKMFYVLALPEQELAITNDKGRIIFRRKYSDQRRILEEVAFLDGTPYFYFKDEDQTAQNHLYKVTGDTVVLIRKFPKGISILAPALHNDVCYFLYKKEVKRKTGHFMDYRFINMSSGVDHLIDSVNFDEDNDLGTFKLYPAESYYTRNQNNILTWHDLNSGYEFKDFGRDEPTLSSIAYSPDGRYLASANPNGKVLLWDLGTGKETKTLEVKSQGSITKLAFSGDGKYLAASSGDIWETAAGKNVVSVTDGSIWAVNSIDFSNDGQRIVSGGACIISWDAADGAKLVFQQEPGKKNMDTTGTCWNPNGCVDPNFKFMVFSTALHPDSRHFVAGNKNGVVQKWNTENDSLYAYKIFENIPGQDDHKVYDLKYTRDGKWIIAVQQKCIYRLNAHSLMVEDSLLLPEGEKILGVDMGYDGNSFGCITERNNSRIVQLRNIAGLAVTKEFLTSGASFNKLSFSPNKLHAATASDDGFCTIWDIGKGKEVMYLNSIGDYGNVMVTPDNYYMASKSALDGVSFFKDSSFYSFDQFDLYLNRPDIVLGRLGYAAPELLNFYRTAYFKRLKKATGSVTDTVVNDKVPALKLLNRKTITAVNTSGNTKLNFEITAAGAQAGNLRIYVNGNLVKEIQTPVATTATFLIEDSVALGYGKNNVEAVYSTQSGAESRKEKITLSYSPAKKIAPKVWFVGVGISNYQNAAMNLKYPVKDIRDISRDFKKKYPGLLVDSLLNEKATKAGILALRQKLMQTGINDKVIVSFSGHGLLSDSLDWYFATHDIDFKQPEINGLSYAMMEGILDGIPARQKLLLLDACHSGEVDKESDITFENRETNFAENVVTTNTSARGNIVLSKSKAGLQTSFEMMQDLFANLNNGNGTTVLSAAGGTEYALESDQWKNGVFTYSLLKALRDPATDENLNKKISVKELKKAVFTSVQTLTGGRQKPTSRVELLDDWDIW